MGLEAAGDEKSERTHLKHEHEPDSENTVLENQASSTGTDALGTKSPATGLAKPGKLSSQSRSVQRQHYVESRLIKILSLTCFQPRMVVQTRYLLKRPVQRTSPNRW